MSLTEISKLFNLLKSVSDSIYSSFANFFSESGYIGYVIVGVIAWVILEIIICSSQLGTYFGDFFYYWVLADLLNSVGL